ncbi:MAG: hypothetical protein GX941_05080 [Candidatus Methanofastidiosa archaeon]|nr:hypothetical protein [Candidatus Methanofastidiosa archaeon]
MIIFDEKKYAENLLRNGYKNRKYINNDNIILVKYWKYKGFNKEKIKKKLKAFMEEYQNLFNSDIIDIKINRAMKIGMNYDLSTGITIDILDNEIEEINKLDKIELRKMMFILLVVWKFRGMPKRFRMTNIDIIKLSEVNLYHNAFWDCIFEITKSGLLSMKQYKNKDYYVVNMKQKGNIIFQISNFTNPIDYYMQLIEPENYKKCEECGVVIKITSNRKTYCDSCWREIERELRKEINKKYYESKIKTV